MMSFRSTVSTLLLASSLFAFGPDTQPAEPSRPTARTRLEIAGWTVQVDDRLWQSPNQEVGHRALQLLEAKLADINSIVAPEPLAKLQSVTIFLDLTHGQLHAMQYHPSADWLADHGYSRDMARCVHIPEAADFTSPQHNSVQPWCVLHELAHAYHDQVLGFEEPRILQAFAHFKAGGHGDSALLMTGERVRHYALTDQKEFFAEMTEAYFGMNDFFPFNRGELMTAEPEIYELMQTIWGPVAGHRPAFAANHTAVRPTVPPADVDKIFAQWDRPDSPGCALAVIQDGETVYQRGYGSANLEYAVPITPSTIFHVASVSKQFTALAVLLLAQEGKLGLDDDIRKYIPEMPDFGKTITPRHLIHHLSGLRDTWELLQFGGWRMEDVITLRDALDMTWRQRELNIDPGERYCYCNGGYMLLGVLVQKVSGQTLAEFCQQRIFGPLGMSHTHFHDDYQMIVPNRAYSYDPKRGGGFRHNVVIFAISGPTSLFTTVEDLARWDQNFYDAQVGGRAVIDLMHLRGKLNSGKQLDYAAAIAHGTYRGLHTVGHTGARAGFRSVHLRFPDQRFSVIILANVSNVVPATLARRVADLYLGEQMKPVAPPPAAKPAMAGADPGKYDGYAGSYWFEDGTVKRFVRAGDRLAIKSGAARTALTEVAPADFAEERSTVRYTFVADADGKTHEVRRQADDQEPALGTKIEPAPLPPAKAAEYLGDFYSIEMEAIYNVREQAGRLMLRHRKDEQPLLLVKDDVFVTHFDENGREGDDLIKVRFFRDDQGKVGGFRIDNGRAKGLRFVPIMLPK